MTRHGTLIYYFTAWAVGCFSIALALWTKEWIVHELDSSWRNKAFELIAFSFYALIFGALVSLLGGFLLRRVISALKSHNLVFWSAAASILAPAIIALLSWADLGLQVALTAGAGPRYAFYSVVRFFVFIGVGVIIQHGWWLSIPAGAATGYLLGRVDRAFAAQHANV